MHTNFYIKNIQEILEIENGQEIVDGMISSFTCPINKTEEQLKEYGQMRNAVEEATDEHTKKCFITALFDALMVDKIKTYSLNYDAPAILSDELHDEYLRQNVYDDGEF